MLQRFNGYKPYLHLSIAMTVFCAIVFTFNLIRINVTDYGEGFWVGLTIFFEALMVAIMFFFLLGCVFWLIYYVIRLSKAKKYVFNTYNDYYQFYINSFKKDLLIIGSFMLVSGFISLVGFAIGDSWIGTMMSGFCWIIFISLPICLPAVFMHLYTIRKLKEYITYNNLYAQTQINNQGLTTNKIY